MEKLKVGILGCNYMGKMHASCYRAIDGAEVVAVADVNEETANALAKEHGAKAFTDAMKLIETCELDAVDICLPTFLHAEYALKAMEKVKYVFIEKPVALNLEECEKLLEKQRETGAQVQVGQVIRFWDEYVFLKEAYEKGTYGKLINLTLKRISPSPKWGWKSWMQNSKLSGGAILDLHIHDIDYMISLFGLPKTSHRIKNTLGEQNSYITTICEYEDFVVSVEGTWYLPTTYPFNMYYRAVFENAVVELDKGELTVYDAEKSYKPELTKRVVATASAGGNISELGGYLNELEYFVSQAKKGAKIEKAALADGVQSLRFILENSY